MGVYISNNIISENGLTATTSNIINVISNSLSATTLYGVGSGITNVSTNTVILNNDNYSIQYNNNGILSGSSNFIYSGNTLSFTGDSVFNGLFYKLNSPSVKQVHQWGGTVTVGVTPGIIWTNMPAGTSTWLNTAAVITNDANYITDLTEYTECRLFTSMQVAGARTGTSLTVQYFNNETVQFETLVSVTIGNTTGVKDSGWISIPIIAKTETTIRLIGSNGDPSALIDPRFSPPILLIR